MEEIKGGGRRRVAAKKVAPKYDPANDIANEVAPEDVAKPTSATKAAAIPKTIEAKRTPQLLSVVPGWVWKCGKFRWMPQDFGTENERMKERVIDSSKQDQSIGMFLDDPTTPMLYCVAGSPDDRQALYFAAYLVQEFQKRSREEVVWHNLYGGFDNPVLRKYDDTEVLRDPGMLVLTNLSPKSTNTKLDKTRDLVTRFANIPRVLVVAGEDPISFCCARLNIEVNGIAYFRGNALKQRIETI